MQTSAHPSPSALCEIAGKLVQPIELRALPDGSHVLCVVLSNSPYTGGARAQVRIEPGAKALSDAEALADRINLAAKQGRSGIKLIAPLLEATLHLRMADIMAHEEPERMELHAPSPASKAFSKPAAKASAPAAPSFKSLAANDVHDALAEPALF
jgi:hypothetical protein